MVADASIDVKTPIIHTNIDQDLDHDKYKQENRMVCGKTDEALLTVLVMF